MVSCMSVCLSIWVGCLPYLRPGLHGLRVTGLPSLDQKCNPHLLTHLSNGTILAGPEGYETHWWDAPSIVGLIIFILCTVFIR